MDQELTEQFNENMRQLSEMMAQLNSTMAGTVKSMNDASVASKNAATSTKQSADSQTNSTTQVVTGNTKLQEAQKKSSDIMAESAKRFADAGYAAGSALKSFTQAALSGEEGFKKYGSAVGSLGNSALALGSNFGKLGTFAGVVTKAFSSAAELWLKQADGLLSASDSISKLGAANRFTTNDIMKMGHGAGLTSLELDKLIKPIQTVSGGFVGLGLTQSDGIKRFSEMVAVTEKTRKEFQRLGLNDQERIQAQADFVSLMNKSGAGFQGSLKTQQGLQKASLDYTRNLYELAALTGQDIESAKKQLEISQASYEWSLLENQWAMKKKAAEEAGDTKELRRIEKEEAAAKAMNAKLAYDPVKQAAFQQRYLTGAVTDLSVQFDIAGVAMDQYIAQMKAGTDVSGQVMNDLKNSGQKLTDTLGPVALGLSEDLRKVTGQTKEQIQFQTRRMGLDEASAAQQAKDALEANKNNKGPVAEDPAQKIRNALTEAERKARIKVDEFALSFNPLIGNNGAMKLLAGTATAAAVALGAVGVAKLVGGIASLFKGKLGSKGNPMYVKMDGAGILADIADRAGAAGKITGGLRKNKSGRWINESGKFASAAEVAEHEAAQAAKSIGKLGKLSKVLGKFGKITSALAVVGSAVSAFSEWSDASTQASAGNITSEEAAKRKAEAVGGAGGSMAGGAIGTALGTAILPGIGTVLGGMLGTALGDKLGRIGADKLTGVLDSAMAPVKAFSSGVGEVLDSLKPAATWITKAIGDISGMFFSLSKLVLYPFYYAGLKVSEGFNKISAGLTGWLKEHPRVVAAFKTVGGWLNNLAEGIKKFFGMIGDKLGSWNKGFKDWVNSLYGEKESPASKGKPTPAVKPPAPKPVQSKTATRPTNAAHNKTPEQEKQEQEAIDKTQESAKTVSESSTRTELSSKKTEESTKKFDNIVASFGKIVASDGQIVAAFGKIVIAFNDAVTKFSDNITTFGDVFSMQGGSGSTLGATTGGTDPAKIQQAMSFLTNKGWSQAQAAGIVGNLVTESKLNTSAVGDNGKAYGIAQWHPDRQAKFKEVMGKDIRGSRLEDQLAFLDWELRNTEKKAGTALMGASTAAQAASIFDRKYERSSGAAIQERMANANAIASGNFSGESGIGTGDSNIIALGRMLQSQGFRVDQNPAFLPFNPKAHKGKGHAEGRAIDVNIGYGVNEATDPAASARMDALAAQLANNPNLTVLWKTAGHYDHMHVETKRGVQAAKGGVFAGSRAGYPATLHGTEMVAPLNLDSVLMKLAKTSTGTPEGQELLGEVKKTAGSSTADVDKISLFNKEVASMITAKLDKMIDILDDGNNTRHKILQHSRS